MQQNSKAAAAAAKTQKLQGCSALCCSCRLSVSSSSEESESSSSDRYPTISSLTHVMAQEKLDKMIREREEAKNEKRRRRRRRGEREQKTKFIVMIAMEKSSYDPRKDFRESIEQMIMANRIHDTKDLRRLLNYYVSMNAEEYYGIILEVFHQVCTTFFISCKHPSSHQL